ncbi:MAG: hypothetical protein AAF490_10065, partial [Chloroflexota bacterium]
MGRQQQAASGLNHRFIHFGKLILVLAIFGSISLIVVSSSTLAAKSHMASGGNSTPLIHLPYFANEVLLSQRAIFWFGDLSNTNNYADVRVGYNDENIVVQIPVFDRLLYFDNTPTVAELEDWDSVSLYLNLDGAVGNAPTTASYWFIGQHNKSQGSTTHYGVYRGNGTNWVQDSISFSLGSGTQASGFNDQTNDRGYWVSFVIPFDSLGLAGKPE